MLHLCRTKTKLSILAVNRRPVRKGRKIAGDKSALLYAFGIATINKQLTTLLNATTADAHTV